MKPIKNHTNEVYGRLTALEFVERKKSKTYWKCKCSCGNEIIIPITYLTTGDTRSCGCLRKELNKENGQKRRFVQNHRLYSIWIDMKRRCNNTNRNSYKYYVMKGIKICEEWLNDFRVFQDWAFSNGYKDNLTIDRINNDGNYEPSNCRWVTTFEQNNNMSTNHKIVYKGKTYKTMSSFCREMNIDYSKFRQNIRYGKTVEEALTKCGVQ